MPLSKRPEPYVIPEYSLTGDLLSYLSCGLQYRYQNKGSLPPSTPVQLWFGEFIHSVMEEAYLVWLDTQMRFPWDWGTEIREIELGINKRLKSRGLYPPPNLFCPYDSSITKKGLCPDANHPHKMIASQRAETSINTWGKHLFPLIDNAEVKLKGIRPMPNFHQGISRSNYYGITGIVDVISSVTLNNAPSGNLILNYIYTDQEINKKINNLSSEEYEIIIDYKGMRRPSINSDEWKYHQWQIMTYSWLRSLQSEAKEVVACILFYLNELEPSKTDMVELIEDVFNNQTDIMPEGRDLKNIYSWDRKSAIPQLSTHFKEKRSIRVLPVKQILIDTSLLQFDDTVGKIENSVFSEINGNGIKKSWKENYLERRCTACDFKTFCPEGEKKYNLNVP